MQIKGTAVSSIRAYVKRKYPERFDEWMQKLPKNAAKIFQDGVYANKWFPMKEACIIPTQHIGDMFFGGKRTEAAWDCGRFSAETSLKGLYWFYVKAGNPKHIIQRATRIFTAYYYPSDLVVENLDKQSLEVVIKKFDVPNSIVEARIAGWIEQALIISGCNQIQVEITESMTKGAKNTRFSVQWS